MENSLRFKRLNNIRQIDIVDAESENPNIKAFLSNVVPRQLEYFLFGGGNYVKDENGLWRIEQYIKELKSVLKITTMMVKFSRCR